MTPVISVEHLSKAYRLGQIGTGTLTYDMKLWWAKLRGKPNPLLRIGEKDHGNREGETIWALKDVSFAVEQGEVLGIIGRNGAGKSTLLKILSRVTAPTSGKIKVRGRVASLLEVGTGFHPDLTGRENIYLNGAILGMSRKEIDRKFDEIVSFADVEKFVDTPVKRYSSGMYVRLAFAVAAHLESEILIVDEVLAVGDAEFQKKCLGKMQDISKNEGRTVLFVSHNMQAITNLCSRAILLHKGTVVQDSITQDAVRHYLMLHASKDGAIYWDDDSALGDSSVKLKAIKILDQDNNIRNLFFSKSKIRIQFDFDILEMDKDLLIGFDITNEDGMIIFRSEQNDNEQRYWPVLKERHNSIYCEIPGGILNAGTYYISPKISVFYKKWIINGDPLLSFEVELDHGVSRFWSRTSKANPRPGTLAVILPWKESNAN